MVQELMHNHHKALSILRMIKELEGKIQTAHTWLKNKENPFYREYRYGYIHDIDIYTRSVKRLFERHQSIINKLT